MVFLPNISNLGIDSFTRRLNVDPDPFQVQAFEAIDKDKSVMVAAPTGSGKTLVAQYGVDRAINRGLRAFYTTPLKALSNQKYNEFVDLYTSDAVGLLTGDNVINNDAPVVVMTTEVLRNMLYEGTSNLDDLAYVVLDEVHYLQNPYRGAVWEEVIIHLPRHTKLICLSATVSNLDEFGEWIRTVRGDLEVIVERHRPVELNHLYGVYDDRERSFKILDALIDGKLNNECSRFDDPRIKQRGFYKHNGSRRRPPRRGEVIDELLDRSMLPAIYFVFSRSGCDQAVESALASNVKLTTPFERSIIREIVDRSITNLTLADLEALRYDTFIAGMEAGFAAHHAGMVPPMKEAVEECFARSLIKVVFATETLSLGINMPARSVVIEKLNKFNGDTHEILTPAEYTQLAGRAGRRGIDNVGYSVSLWSPFVAFETVANLMATESYPLTSSFRPTYNMAANLVKGFEPDSARNLLNLSFAQFRSGAEVVHLEATIARLKDALPELERAILCEYGDVATIYDTVARKAKRAATRQIPPEKLIHSYIGRLRPGDIIVAPANEDSLFPSTRLIVVATSKKKGGKVTAHLVSASGFRYQIRPNLIDFLPKALDNAVVEEEYDPWNHLYIEALIAKLIDYPIANCGTAEPRLSRETIDDSDQRDEIETEAIRDQLRSCKDFSRHLSALKKLRKAQSRIKELEIEVAGHTDSLSRQFDRVIELLEGLGLISGWSLTSSGERLAGLFHESDLLIELALEEGVFDGLDPYSLAALLSIFVFEPRTSAPGSDRFPTRELEERFESVQQIRVRLNQLEARYKVPPTKSVESGFMVYASQWARGRDLGRVIGDGQVPGGDFVRFTKQILDLSRQLETITSDPEFKAVVRQLDAMLCRGIVEASMRVG